MVALENGEVYAWGYNGNGQLGLGNNINQLNACKITTLSGIVITKVKLHWHYNTDYLLAMLVNNDCHLSIFMKKA